MGSTYRHPDHVKLLDRLYAADAKRPVPTPTPDQQAAQTALLRTPKTRWSKTLSLPVAVVRNMVDRAAISIRRSTAVPDPLTHEQQELLISTIIENSLTDTILFSVSHTASMANDQVMPATLIALLPGCDDRDFTTFLTAKNYIFLSREETAAGLSSHVRMILLTGFGTDTAVAYAVDSNKKSEGIQNPFRRLTHRVLTRFLLMREHVLLLNSTGTRYALNKELPSGIINIHMVTFGPYNITGDGELMSWVNLMSILCRVKKTDYRPIRNRLTADRLTLVSALTNPAAALPHLEEGVFSVIDEFEPSEEQIVEMTKYTVEQDLTKKPDWIKHPVVMIIDHPDHDTPVAPKPEPASQSRLTNKGKPVVARKTKKPPQTPPKGNKRKRTRKIGPRSKTARTHFQESDEENEPEPEEDKEPVVEPEPQPENQLEEQAAEAPEQDTDEEDEVIRSPKHKYGVIQDSDPEDRPTADSPVTDHFPPGSELTERDKQLIGGVQVGMIDACKQMEASMDAKLEAGLVEVFQRLEVSLDTKLAVMKKEIIAALAAADPTASTSKISPKRGRDQSDSEEEDSSQSKKKKKDKNPISLFEKAASIGARSNCFWSIPKNWITYQERLHILFRGSLLSDLLPYAKKSFFIVTDEYNWRNKHQQGRPTPYRCLFCPESSKPTINPHKHLIKQNVVHHIAPDITVGFFLHQDVADDDTDETYPIHLQLAKEIYRLHLNGPPPFFRTGEKNLPGPPIEPNPDIGQDGRPILE